MHVALQRLVDLHLATVGPAAIGHAATSAAATRSEDSRLLREHAPGTGVDLGVPELPGALGPALAARRTERSLSGSPLSRRELSTLLAFGAGSAARPALPSTLGGPPGTRTYPSGGGLYPVEVIVRPVLVDGLAPRHYRYQALAHRLVEIDGPRVEPSAIERMHIENGVAGAAVVFLLWIDFTRPSLEKYGGKAYRLALLEAGHLAQNFLLIGAALGLAGVPLCGFDDQALATEAGLDYTDEAVVYAVSLGSAA